MAPERPARRPKRLPEYLEASEVQAVIDGAPNGDARLLMFLQWRGGLRISEALAVTAADFSLDADRPTLRVRQAKGAKDRVVPVHPELSTEVRHFLIHHAKDKGPLVTVHPSTAWRWVKAAVKAAEGLGRLPAGRRVSTHTLRHSYARHLLNNGVAIHNLSRWMGHSSISVTLIYLELTGDPAGQLAQVP